MKRIQIPPLNKEQLGALEELYQKRQAALPDEGHTVFLVQHKPDFFEMIDGDSLICYTRVCQSRFVGPIGITNPKVI